MNLNFVVQNEAGDRLGFNIELSEQTIQNSPAMQKVLRREIAQNEEAWYRARRELEGKLSTLQAKLNAMEKALRADPKMSLDEGLHRYVWGIRGDQEWNASAERWEKSAKGPVG